MQIIAWGITALTIANLLLPMLATSLQPFVKSADRRRIPPARLGWVLGILAAVLAFVCLVPVPYRLTAPLVVEAEDAEHLFVSVPGRLIDAKLAGQTVSEGETIATLENPGLTLQREQAAVQLDLAKRQLSMLLSVRGEDEESATQIPAARKNISDLTRRMETLDRNLSRLTIVSPRDGTILAPPNVPEEPREREDLGTWTGSPLAPENRGSSLEAGTELCLVGDESQLIATLFVAEEDLPFVRTDQPVEILLDGLGDRTFFGEVSEISAVPVERLPREIVTNQLVPLDPEDTQQQRPLAPVYQVRVQFDEIPNSIIRRGCGTARIRVASEPLAGRFWRAVRRTFHFEL